MSNEENEEKYLEMQRRQYNDEANRWNLGNKDPVVGAWGQHEAWPDYDEYLFKDIPDLNQKIALDYGCGPGRNLVRFSTKFKEIDGVDISSECIKKAKIYVESCGVKNVHCLTGSGDEIPITENDIYDVVFSVICLQHIAVHSIRFKLMKEFHRVLKPGGYFCAQMGFGGRPDSVGYYANEFDAPGTNGVRDVSIENEDYLKNDLSVVGFKDYKSWFRPVCSDLHAQWIWFQARK
jgi:ubiquinone/menaquinone biosynthesis C-methylase UbiE